MILGPVFIAGLERSGTSLIYALLGSHPRIAMSRRTNLWTHFYKQYGDLAVERNFERCLGVMLSYKRVRKLNPDADRLRREFKQGEPTYPRLFALLEEHYAEQCGKPRWGDKSLNTERYADQIMASYPEARILHMIRDPRDRFASSLTRWKKMLGGVGFGTAMWLNSLRLAERHQARYPDRYRIVRYEDLASRAEATLKEICTFIGEGYSPEMLAMGSAEKFSQGGGNSSYGQRDPGIISASSVGKFRQVMSAQQVAFMQLFTAQKMKRIGYEIEPVHFSTGQRAKFIVFTVPFECIRMAVWYVREALLNLIGREVPEGRLIHETTSAEVEA